MKMPKESSQDDMIAVEKKRHIWLLFAMRAFVQGVRLVWVPLMVFVAEQENLTLVEQGHVLSSFSLGYLMTQVPGGMAADKYGGKLVQTQCVVVMSVGMIMAPFTAGLFGFRGLWLLYFAMGFSAGPQHPAYNQMVTIWYPQEELGHVSTVCEAGPVAGNFFALLVAPPVASFFGWPAAFYLIGFMTMGFAVVWQQRAIASPADVVTEIRPHEVAPLKALDDDELDEDDDRLEDDDEPQEHRIKLARTPPDSPKLSSTSGPNQKCLPVECALSSAVWCVMIQHCIFNGTKYFFASWMPMFFSQQFGMAPHRSGFLLTFPEAMGLVLPVVVSRAEKYTLAPDGLNFSLLQSRKLFACSAFTLVCIPIFLMGLGPSGPVYMAVLLCMMSATLVLHSPGFKSNYLDITIKYQGLFMGVGNTLASFVTFLVPIVVAYSLEASNNDWSLVFFSMVFLNLGGTALAYLLTSVKRIDNEARISDKTEDDDELVMQD